MIPLRSALALHIHEMTSLVILSVGFVALALAIVGRQALRRSRNRALRFVWIAFLIFALKGFFAAWGVWTGAVRHEHMELALALADLAIVLLLIAPLFLGKRSPA